MGDYQGLGAEFEESGGVHNHPIITLASDHRESRDMSRATSRLEKEFMRITLNTVQSLEADVQIIDIGTSLLPCKDDY